MEVVSSVVVSVSVVGSSKRVVRLDDELEDEDLEEDDELEVRPVVTPPGGWVDHTVETVSVTGTPRALVPVETTMVFPSSYGNVMVTCASTVLENSSDASAAASA